MINLKKIDEKDIVFVKKIFTEKEDLAFSEFLKNRKKATKSAKNPAPARILSRGNQ